MSSSSSSSSTASQDSQSNDHVITHANQQHKSLSISSSFRSPSKHLLFLTSCFIVLVLAILHNQSNDQHSSAAIPSSAPVRRLSRNGNDDHSSGHFFNDGYESDEPFHPLDTLFGISPQQPLPATLVRRLAEMESSGPTKALQSASLYGGIYDYAYYFVSILVGTPPQRQSVIVDSGSSLLGFPCYNCRECGHSHMDQGFDFSKSKTSRWLSCHDPQCITGRCGLGDVCPYQQSYSEGSSIEGNYFSDVVALGEQEHNNSFVRFDHIGCHDRETNLFVSQKASGILGVSYPKRGKQETLIDALFKSPDVDTKIFAICAAEEGGLLTVGGYNSSLHRLSRTQGSTTLRMLGLSQTLRFDMDSRKRILNGAPFSGALDNEPRSRLRNLLEERNRRILIEGNNTLGLPVGVPEQQVDNGNIVYDQSIVEGASVGVAWTPVTSSTTYQIDVLEMIALEEAGNNNESSSSENQNNAGTQIATDADLGHCIVDSGTTFSYLAPRAFQAFMNVLDRSCTARTASFCVSRATTSSDGLCWKIDSSAMFNLLPSFLLKLRGGSVVEWKAHSYLHRRAKTKTWCVAVDDNRHSTSILGMSFMKQKNVIFDRERDLLGFAEANCPTVSDTSRPPPPTFPPPTTTTTTSVAIAAGLSGVLNEQVPTVASVDFELAQTNISISEDDDNVSSVLLDSNSSLLWASAGLFMGVGVVAMGAITFKTIRGRPQDYQPMDVNVRERSTRGANDDLEMAISREDDDDKASLASQGVGKNRNRQLSYIDEEDNETVDLQFEEIEKELDEMTNTLGTRQTR